MTMTLISTTTLGSNAASIEFTSLPATFTDLFIVYSLRHSNSGNETARIDFNGVSTSQTARNLIGWGSGVSSASYTNLLIRDIPGTDTTSNTFSSTQVYIPNYAGSTNKSVSIDHVTENNATNAYFSGIVAGLWSNTAAITSVKILDQDGGSLVAGSTASIYGILKGSGGATVS